MIDDRQKNSRFLATFCSRTFQRRAKPSSEVAFLPTPASQGAQVDPGSTIPSM
jgi:hypothetical protein